MDPLFIIGMAIFTVVACLTFVVVLAWVADEIQQLLHDRKILREADKIAKNELAAICDQLRAGGNASYLVPEAMRKIAKVDPDIRLCLSINRDLIKVVECTVFKYRFDGQRTFLGVRKWKATRLDDSLKVLLGGCTCKIIDPTTY